MIPRRHSSRPTAARTLRNRFRRDERGAVGVFLGLGMTVFLGSAALAIDLGHLMNARTESQRVADLAALAGAAAFINAPGPTVAQTADLWAKDFASRNTIDGVPVTLQSSDILVDVANERVRVNVVNAQARGNPISTIFARVLGISSVDVSSTAVAEAWPAAGVTCVLPLFLVDRWDENGGNPNYYDDPPDYYEPYDPTNPTSSYTGYDQAAIGTSIVIKPANGPKAQAGRPNDSWYFPFDAADIPGGANYRSAIAGCTDPEFIYSIDQLLWVEPGAMIGPTAQGFKDLIDQAPSHRWHDGKQCVVDSAASDPNACIGGSPRIRPVPMMAPTDTPANGKKQVHIKNFAGVFVDRVQGNNVYVIFAGYSGITPAGGGGGGGTTPPILKTLRLIE